VNLTWHVQLKAVIATHVINAAIFKLKHDTIFAPMRRKLEQRCGGRLPASLHFGRQGIISFCSHYFRRRPLNQNHVVVKNGLLAAIVPFDDQARPIFFSDGALIVYIIVPANPVANF
jgi:hypothetical protein